MKIIFRLISATLFVLAAAACNLSEINNPDDPNNNGSGKKEYSITAKIIQTRVKYTDGTVLKQEWKTGDILIGCYSSSGVQKIKFSVGSINADGSANLNLVSGNLPGDGIRIALLYDPYRNRVLDGDGSLVVNLENQYFDIDNQDNQDSPVLPAFMSASAVYSETGGATFNFQNDCAIIEVDGIYKTMMSSGSEIKTVSSIRIDNVIATGSYSFDPDNGIFSLNGDNNDAESSIKVSCSRALDWETGVLDKPVFLAVIPNEEATIDVSFSDGTTTCEVEGYGKTAFVAGKCYVIYPKEMVAKTVDNQYFPSVAAAFEHAAVLYGTLETGVENTVTLVKKNISGFGTPKNATSYDGEIKISYDVTLDLNGCTLSLDDIDGGGSECFYVDELSNFTIIDSKKSGGTLESDAACHIIYNSGGAIVVDSGTIRHNNEWSTISNEEGTLDIISGYLSSVDWHAVQNSGTCKVYDGELYSVTESAIQSEGILEVNGGTLVSESSNAILCEFCPSIKINGESTYISSNSSRSQAIYVKAWGDNSPTIFTMTDGTVYGKYGAIYSEGYVNFNFSGGIVESDNYHSLCMFNFDSDICPNPVCTISGGEFINNGANSAIYCFAQNDDNALTNTLTIKWANNNAADSKELGQPLMYSASSYPINAKYYNSGVNNFAKIVISGGYLYSGILNSKTRDFYDERDDPSDDYNCLSLPDDTYIYSNSSKMYISDSYVDLLFSVEGDKSMGGGNLAYPCSVSITPMSSSVGELTFTNYITIPKQTLAPPSGTAEYRFEFFGW